jgi:circadian clock protein KaiC
MIEGGFLKGSLILVAGNPGTGKSVFSAHFIYRGAVDYGEKGVYVTFAERKRDFIDYMRRFGMDFEGLEKKGMVKILDMLTVKDASISDMFNIIVEEILHLNAKRLVIDSFSAMAQAFKEKIEARIILHTVLGKITKSTGCTTLLIVEIPYGQQSMGLGIEEFVADGIILLKRSREGGREIE